MHSEFTSCKRSMEPLPMIGIKILRADYFEISPTSQGWIIDLSVSRGNNEVKGSVFKSSEFTEIRFEYECSLNPPHFICGYLCPVPIENNSLCSLLDLCCPGKIEQLEEWIRSYLDLVIFCVTTLYDVNNDIEYKRALSFSVPGSGIIINMGHD